MPSRRSFLQKSAMFAIATSATVPAFAMGGQDDLTISQQIGQQSMAGDPQSTFEKWIDGQFRISWGKSNLGLMTLARVESTLFPQAAASEQTVPVRTPSGKSNSGTLVQEIKSTSLTFSRSAAFLRQEVYTMDHDWLGTFNLLLVPSVSLTQPVTYVAIFTRFTGRRVPLS